MAETKGRILIVDDEKLQREIIIMTLKKVGYELSEAAGVRDALSLLEKREFDLILTDLMMQGQTGMDLLEQVQKVTKPIERAVSGISRLERRASGSRRPIGVSQALPVPSSLSGKETVPSPVSIRGLGWDCLSPSS